jgi:hypothetical protein
MRLSEKIGIVLPDFWYNNYVKLNKNIVNFKKMTDQEDYFVDASPKDLLSFMWELTAEVWSLRGDDRVKRRLQRNVTNLIRQ